MKQFILLLTVAALIGYSQAQGNRKCAANGEYCLTHSECCSGSCLSFSYKCVPVPPGPIIGTTRVPVTVDTGNRFGGSNGDGGASFTQKTCAANGEYCLTGIECCSGACLSFSYKCVPVQPPLPGDNTGTKPDQSGAAATTVPAGSNTVDLGNRVGEDQSPAPPASVTTASTSTAGSTTPRKCATLGEYCLTAADCCSRSCLSFSYKCVQNYDLNTQLTQSGLPVQLPPVGASGNNGIDTANRFGGSGKQCTANGLYCYHNHECCSGACYKSFCSTEIRLGVPESELTRPSAANGPYVQVNSLDDLITRFGGGSSQGVADSDASASHKRIHHSHVGSRSTAARQCVVIGEGCSRHEDCCSRKCLTYIRKCVT